VLIGETVTDRNGRYQYDTEDGFTVGTFVVWQVLPAGFVQTTANPGDIVFSRGDQFGVANFGSARSRTAALMAATTGAEAAATAPAAETPAAAPGVAALTETTSLPSGAAQAGTAPAQDATPLGVTAEAPPAQQPEPGTAAEPATDAAAATEQEDLRTELIDLGLPATGDFSALE
jgi:hypothetical protein